MLSSHKKKHRKALAIFLSFAIVFTTYGSTGFAIGYAAESAEPALPELEIANVEELVGGETQVLYRDEVYKGNADNGEDPEKYYTTYREINLKDPRVFNFEFTVDAEAVTDEETFLDTVSLQYGGLDLEEWVWDGFRSSVAPKTTSVLSIKDKELIKNEDGSYTVRVAMETDTAWTTSSQNARNNIPYNNYGAGRQFDFSTGQSADNRAWWQAGPLGTGVGTYTMTATLNGEAVAATDIHIAPYDGMYSWIEINEYAQSLIKAITGSEYPIEKLDGHTTGTIAAGYVGVDENGNFVKGNKNDNVYVEVAVLGYGLTDNYKEENKDFNNYSQYNAIWNIVVAMDEETVDSYLNETVPAMNTNPQALIDEIKDQKDEDIDLMQVYYQNNVHPDEVSGTDTMIKLVTDMIEGGKAGQNIEYKTWTLEDMDLYYRDPAEGALQGESGHVVKGGYDETGIFMQDDTRTDAVFSTKEALDKFIFVSTLCSNPDGRAGMRRTNRYAIDLNRDAVFSTLPETIALMNDLMKWDPLVMNEWHGYVTQMLIEPTTAPHDPAYDYDLLQNTMLNLAYASGLAATGSTGMQRFLVPWDHYDGGDWDDGGTIYAPMFAMLFGCYGFTIEFPYSNLDSLEANDVINYAMIEELLRGETEFFSGNRLNGELEDVDGNTYASHEEDIKYTSMRKATLIGKLETKVRGINNVDAKETVDKYFIDKKADENGNMVDRVVGRARPTDANGNELSFFPDYIVIPTDETNQYNVAEGIKAINQLLGWKIDVSMSTEAVTYDGTEIPEGAYVLDMRQSRRNVIFETMSKGYDATGFSSMYADIYCNLPDVRGFDSIQVYGAGLFDGKLQAVAAAEKEANIKGTEAEYVVFKSQSTDAVRFVNLLLTGYSSGPSYSEKGDVWMLREAVDGVGSASDYVIKAADLAKLDNLVDNPVLGLNGCHIEGKYIAELPDEAVQLVEPVIQLNTTRTSQSGGPIWWMLDDYLGFASMKDYNGSTSLREGANVIIANNQSSLSTAFTDAVKDGTGIIFIRNANALSTLDTDITAPSRSSFSDVAINGQYNVDNSLFTENYATTTTYYARGYKYTNVPEDAKILFQSDADKDTAFIGGFQNTKGQKDTFKNAVTMFSTILENDGNPSQVLVIGQQLDYRTHYQKLLPMLATAIYASAAGILDDQNDPVINKPVIDGKKVVIRAAEADKGVAESGLEKLSVYLVKGDKEQLIEESTAGKVTFIPSEDMKVKAVATDYAGNQTVKTFKIEAAEGTVENEEKTPAESVDELIAAIGTVTADSAEAIEAARADYDALSAEEKAKVENYQALVNAELAYKNIQLKEDAAAAEAELKEEIAALEEALKNAGDVSAAEKAAMEAELAELQAALDEVTKEQQLAAPTGLKGSNIAKTGKVKLTWTAVEGADEYVVYRATKKDGAYKKMFTTTGTSYTNTSAKAGTTYYYKVKAVCDDKSVENSKFSKIVTRTCDLARPDVKASNVAKTGKVKLTWNKVAGAEKYKVYRAASKDGEYKLLKTTTKTSFINTSTVAGKVYYYKVKAIDADNSAANSAYSLVDKRTCDLARPDVKVKSTEKKQIKLTWKKVDKAKKYEIYRATSKNGKYTKVATTTKLSYTNKKLKSGKTYYYKVKAIAGNSAANSAYSLVDKCKCN